jgi:hypothetical protein
MKLQELISKIQESGESTDLKSLINTKSYLPILTQRAIVKSICDMCLYVDEETDMLQCDYVMKELFYVLNTTLECSDIEIDGIIDENGEIDLETAVEAYDLIIEFGVYEHIRFNSRTPKFRTFLDQEIEQKISTYNSVSNVLRKSINSLMDKIPSEANIKELMEQLPTQLSSLGDLQILGNGKKTRSKTKK